jgi:hypothetical protein
MQDTVDQAPAAARTLVGIIAPQPPAESPAIDQDEQIAVIDLDRIRSASATRIRNTPSIPLSASTPPAASHRGSLSITAGIR